MPSSYQANEDAAVKGTDEPSPLAPVLGTNFESVDDSNQLDGFLHRPPDCAMAVGANHIMAAANSLYVIYNKNGAWGSNGRREQCVAYFMPDDVEVAVFVNSPIGPNSASLRGLVKDLYVNALN